jgi:hypothetical protein
MKGIVFNDFLELVEIKFGLEMVGRIIPESQLSSNGIYTAVGTYRFYEMLQLLQNLSHHSKISIDSLLLNYSQYFFSVIQTSRLSFLITYKDPIEMLSFIENYIHIEVKKICSKAEFPIFILEKRYKFFNNAI